MLVTGSGSVKRSGAFDRAISSLKAAGVSVAECSGVEPNPRLSSVVRGAQVAPGEGCNVVIGMGGGSTMDAAKVMAAAVYYEGNPWDMIAHGQENWRLPTGALPIITVPTLAATGSEMNNGAVITDEKTTVKSFVVAECLYPRVALEWGLKAVADGSDFEARAQVQWASVVALNGWVQVGTAAAYPVQMIEHALSSHHDVAHGAGLAVVNPAWMRFAAQARPARFAQFAQRIFGLPEKSAGDAGCALEGVDRFEAFLRSVGCPTRLSKLGIGEAMLPRYAQNTLRIVHDEEGRLPGFPPMREVDIVEILRSAL